MHTANALTKGAVISLALISSSAMAFLNPFSDDKESSTFTINGPTVDITASAPDNSTAATIDDLTTILNHIDKLEETIHEQRSELIWLTKRLDVFQERQKEKAETEEIVIQQGNYVANTSKLSAATYPDYVPSEKSASGDQMQEIKFFGYGYPITKLGIGQSPFFTKLKDVSLAIPYPKANCCGPDAPVIRTGFSTYPRDFIPFSNIYGPPASRVTVKDTVIAGFPADYAIGALSDYGTNYISAVINIQLEDGLFFTIRIGKKDTNEMQSIDDAAREIFRYMDAINIQIKK